MDDFPSFLYFLFVVWFFTPGAEGWVSHPRCHMIILGYARSSSCCTNLFNSSNLCSPFPLACLSASFWGGEVFCKTRIIALRASVLNFCVARCMACLDVSMLPCAHLGQSLWQSHNLPQRAPGVFYSLPKDSSETSNYPWLFACCFILTTERLIFLVCCKEQRQHQGLQGRGKKQSAS